MPHNLRQKCKVFTKNKPMYTNEHAYRPTLGQKVAITLCNLRQLKAS